MQQCYSLSPSSNGPCPLLGFCLQGSPCWSALQSQTFLVIIHLFWGSLRASWCKSVFEGVAVGSCFWKHRNRICRCQRELLI